MGGRVFFLGLDLVLHRKRKADLLGLRLFQLFQLSRVRLQKAPDAACCDRGGIFATVAASSIRELECPLVGVLRPAVVTFELAAGEMDAAAGAPKACSGVHHVRS
eukprot:scaffold600_cov279-Pinguiococcus_pyrenoidosus.AAC.11